MTAHTVFPTAPAPIRLRAEDYVLLDRSGAFERYARTELIEGVIVAVNAEYSRHLRVKSLLYRRLADTLDALGNGLSAWVDGSVELANDSVPQPDILVTDGLPDDGAVPLGRVAMLIEVADSSLENDLKVKTPLYAAAGVSEYWVVDVNGRVIYRMWAPVGEAYTERREVVFDKRIDAVTIAGLAVEAAL